MGSGNFKLYLFFGVLAFIIVTPVVKSSIQEASLGQDIRSIQAEYSMYGREPFRARLDEIIERAPLDPAKVDVRIQEKRPQAKVLIEMRYVSRMKILFIPLDRHVVIRQEIPFAPL